MKKGLLFLALMLMAGVGCSSKNNKKACNCGTGVYNPAAPYQHATPVTTTATT